jgi:propionyl-CoA synthetase
MTYADTHARSLRDPEEFWGEAALGIDWHVKPQQVLDRSSRPIPRWFPGAQLNTCYNALDRHVERGRGAQLALIYDSPLTNTIARYTFEQLRREVARCAGALLELGVKPGDRVLIYMPMIPEAVIAMLACARIAAVHSVVFGGFAAKEIAARIDDARPVLVIAGSCGLEPKRVVAYQPLLEAALAQARHQPRALLIKQRPQLRVQLKAARDHDWDERLAAAREADCIPVPATDPLYILYTSGTTGQPKGIVRDHGGHAVALHWSMKNVYASRPGDVFWAASDVGWVVGHSYIVYGPLLHGNTTVLYEGKPVGTPDPGAFWRVCSEHGVSTLFTAPTAFRAIKKEDPSGQWLTRYDLTKLRALFLAGERSDPATLQWASERLRVPVVDHYWQTETGWAVVANCLGIEQLPFKFGSPTRAVPGWDVCVLDEAGQPSAANATGSLAVKLPLPPGAAPTLWGADARYQETYLEEFPGYYKTADAGYSDADGYLYVMARTDDIINVAGHRLSTGAIEEVLADHPDVAECAVFGVADALKGEIPLGLLVLRDGAERDPRELEAEVVARVREAIGPVAAFKHALIVKRLPKTRSGKILRATMRKIADKQAYSTPATVEDPAVLEEIEQVLAIWTRPE